MGKKNSQIHYAKFNLKSPGERLNIQKLFFPLCSPSFLRRLVFRLREVTPDITSNWSDSYGQTCNIKSDNIVDDANSMFAYINNFKGKDFILEPVQKLELKR